MKIFSAQQIHEWDAFTIAQEPVSSIDLMERAAGACTDHIVQLHFFNRHFIIFCGKGNNGGDGLAIARQLLNRNYTVSIYIIEPGAPGTPDFQCNLNRLHTLNVNIHFIQSEAFFPNIQPDDVVIDALYGSGLNRPLANLGAALINHINQANSFTISIDVPSGMFIDKSSAGNTMIKASLTLSFQRYKLCFLLAENAENTGELVILDIGLHPAFEDTVDSNYQLITGKTVQEIYKPRKPFSHKGTNGHALLIAGSTGKMGAALMAAHACLRTGAGLTTLHIPEKFLSTVHIHLPEAMCSLSEKGLHFEKINAVGIGPGLGTEEDAENLVAETLQQYKAAIVIDADALNIIAANTALMNQLHAGCVLTPHPKEFERLFGKAENDAQRIETALQQSVQHHCTIVLKGRYTFIAHGGKGWFNTTGNAGLAKGGSGDVLTGILTALLAQKYTPLEAALLGVYLHGLAADLALNTQSQESMLARDVIDHIGAAFNALS